MRPMASVSLSRHSQILTTFHPALRNAVSTLRSRSLLEMIFFRQYPTLLFGTL
jgi:hypothetical protein